MVGSARKQEVDSAGDEAFIPEPLSGVVFARHEMKNKADPITIILLTIIGAFMMSLVFMVMTWLTLPPSDKAYGLSVSQVFQDPFVPSIVKPLVGILTLLAFPLAYFLLRETDLPRIEVHEPSKRDRRGGGSRSGNSPVPSWVPSCRLIQG